jgi:RNA 3'-terminal phosphate cyclase (ATP)
MKEIEIDGSYGEGGGQILRTSLALSILTQRPVRIRRIRAGRKSPGLKPQHLMSTQAAAQICDGRTEGAELGATELSFHPGSIRVGRYTFDVAAKAGSAGSVGLIFQTVLLPLGFVRAPSRIVFKGGTHVPWSPTADYLRDVFLPTVATMGVGAELDVPECGFYPIGGGTMNATIHPFRSPLKPLRIKDRGALKKLRVSSAVANLPLSIADRQLNRAIGCLAEHGMASQGESRSVESPGKGTYCFILAEFEQMRAGFSALGAIGKRSEQVADEAAGAFLRFWNLPGALDHHLADQIVLFMAVAKGESEVVLSEMTEHLKTNIWVVEQFLPVKFDLPGDSVGHRIMLRVHGAGIL